MAQKRMFSLQVVDTDEFVDMPISAQALYFHLGMHGDDDGFVSSPKKIARSSGCKDDDLRLLAAKGFIIPFESGVVVITDWRVNNTLQNDRYRETVYQKEKSMLRAQKGGRYLLASSLDTGCIQNASMLEPQLNLTEQNRTKVVADKPPTRHRYGAYENVLLSDEEYAKLKAEFPTDYSQRIERLSEYIASSGKTYKNHLATIRSWARKDCQKHPAGIVLAPLEDPYESAMREGRHA